MIVTVGTRIYTEVVSIAIVSYETFDSVHLVQPDGSTYVISIEHGELYTVSITER